MYVHCAWSACSGLWRFGYSCSSNLSCILIKTSMCSHAKNSSSDSSLTERRGLGGIVTTYQRRCINGKALISSLRHHFVTSPWFIQSPLPRDRTKFRTTYLPSMLVAVRCTCTQQNRRRSWTNLRFTSAEVKGMYTRRSRRGESTDDHTHGVATARTAICIIVRYSRIGETTIPRLNKTIVRYLS